MSRADSNISDDFISIAVRTFNIGFAQSPQIRACCLLCCQGLRQIPKEVSGGCLSSARQADGSLQPSRAASRSPSLTATGQATGAKTPRPFLKLSREYLAVCGPLEDVTESRSRGVLGSVYIFMIFCTR